MVNIILLSPLSNPPTTLVQPEVAGSIYLSPPALANPPTHIQNASGQGSILETVPSAFLTGPCVLNQPVFVPGVSVTIRPAALGNPATQILNGTVATDWKVSAPVLSNPSTQVNAPDVHLGVVVSPAVLSNPSTVILTPATIGLGVTVHPAALNNPHTLILAATFSGGALIAAPVLSNPHTVLGGGQARTSCTVSPAVLSNPSTTILAPTVNKSVVLTVVALTNPATTIDTPSLANGVTFGVLAPLAAAAVHLLQPTLQGTGTSVPVLSLANPSTVLQVAVWSSVDPYQQWPLVLRQQRLYLERVNIFRKVSNAVGDPVWYLLYGNVPVKMFTTPNRDIREGAFLVKQPGVYLFNRLGTVAGVDIRTQDKIQFLGPNQPDSQPLAWYTVKGQSEVKASQGLRRANQQEVYLEPANDPPILGVA